MSNIHLNKELRDFLTFEIKNVLLFLEDHINNQKEAISLLYGFTKKQLQDWEVKFHELFLGKPAGAIYVDDKAMRDIDFFVQMGKRI